MYLVWPAQDEMVSNLMMQNKNHTFLLTHDAFYHTEIARTRLAFFPLDGLIWHGHATEIDFFAHK